MLDEIRSRAAADSPLWAAALIDAAPPDAEYQHRCPDRYLLGVEMIREGYLLHRGRSRLFAQDDAELALLTGDYLYAAGLVEICGTGDLEAVSALAALISRCSARSGDGDDAGNDGLWDSTVAALGGSAR